MLSLKIRGVFIRLRTQVLGNILFSIFFLIILFVPMIEDIIKASPISSESFVGKEQLLSSMGNIKFHVLGDRYFKGVINGYDNWIIYTGENSLNDYQNTHPFTADKIKSIRKRLKNLCATTTKNDIKLLILIPPNKNTIYPEYMPAEIPQINKKSRLDQVMSVWENTDDCQVIDLRNTLLEAKTKNKVYNSTDSHWTDYGAFLAYKQLAQIFRYDFPSVKVRSISDYELRSVIFHGDLTSTFGYFDVQESAVRFEPAFEINYIVRTFDTSPGIRDTVITYADDPTLPVAIIYRDSFFTALIKFVAENFREAYYFWSYKIDFEAVKANKPDYLILEVTERYLETAIFSLPE